VRIRRRVVDVIGHGKLSSCRLAVEGRRSYHHVYVGIDIHKHGQTVAAISIAEVRSGRVLPHRPAVRHSTSNISPSKKHAVLGGRTRDCSRDRDSKDQESFVGLAVAL
jgi:hypothetical protein